ncbi:hypothetical protein AYI69_g5265 [Smittium culicis]|uniref:Uncharacterized protein n=1 Tax=Smittium culicis TaxID=133412 RepID=A0A1R1Y7K0_9FUNG|nr:hypothetical protein AYI69_g5265 [Smittium culicis]
MALCLPQVLGRSVLVYLDNSTTMAYYKKFGETTSKGLLEIVENITGEDNSNNSAHTLEIRYMDPDNNENETILPRMLSATQVIPDPKSGKSPFSRATNGS